MKNPEAETNSSGRDQTREDVQRIEWMLLGSGRESFQESNKTPAYGDLTLLNTERTILGNVDSAALEGIVSDYLRLLATSSAVYEMNGDYALGIFSSGWCQFLDTASRKLCQTDDNQEALRCGKWLCHESCWTKASKEAIEKDTPVDIECEGGLRIFAIPIHIGNEVVGAINFGYGDPPSNKEKIRELAVKYDVNEEELRDLAAKYESRPQFIIDLAKERLFTSAMLIGRIIAHKRAEEALRQTEQRLRLANKATNDVIWDWNVATDLQQWNEAGTAVFGWTEIVEHPVSAAWWVQRVHPDDRQRIHDTFFAVVNNPLLDVWHDEYRFLKSDGAYSDVLDRGYVLRDEQGKAVRMVGAMLDITERKRTEEALRCAQKLESLGLLAGGIAHDFNNLMGGIFGYIDMANEESKEAKVTSYLSKAMNTIERARALTGQLLTFAKGGAPIQKIDHLFPFVEETARFALSGANVSCNFNIPPDLWVCNFDKNQIGQVIDNLIINAQQAMPVGGTIELTARNITLSEKEHPLLTKGNYVKIAVKDTGVGISKEYISKVFDPFFTTKAKGHGLGLATCYSIINRHGGCIDVESEQGKGSTFKIYLPASTEGVSSVTMNNVIMHKGSGTFLVMDDEEVMRDTIKDMLDSLGYTVISKENGNSAIEFFASEIKAKREIVGMIFDLTVPGGMGGKAAIDEIRKTNKDVAAFVASGYADDPVMKNPTEYGFMASICKPFRKSELSEMLNRFMKPKSSVTKLTP